jgi:hypothetical protein
VSFQQDLEMLRQERDGTPLPRVLGNLHLRPYLGWLESKRPTLGGAEITISNGAVTLRATSDETGKFSLPEAPPGDYAVQVSLAPYRLSKDQIDYHTGSPPGRLRVPEAGCGYTEIDLETTSTLRGVVLDSEGKTVRNVGVTVHLKDTTLKEAYELGSLTDRSGRFSIPGVPDTDVYLWAGEETPSLRLRHRRVFYPAGNTLDSAAALRLKPGELREGIVLHVDAPLQRSSVHVRVVNQDGKAAGRVSLELYGGGFKDENLAMASARGTGRFPCLRGQRYELEAAAVKWRGETRELFGTPRVPFICGNLGAPIVLVLESRPATSRKPPSQ